MKPRFAILLMSITSGIALAEEPSPEIEGLQKAAMDFVSAYNTGDANALSQLFTENGEMTDLFAHELITGRNAIKSHYEQIFTEKKTPKIALEVDSVRIVAPNLAIEDGTAHFTPDGENEPPRSTAYTAVLQKSGDQWQVASTRSLADTTTAAGQLADLAKLLNGEWSAITQSGMRLDMAIGWDSSGKFLTGDVVVSSADTPAQGGSIRISWNAARKSIVSWFFDADGGSSQGVWTLTEKGWTVRSEGTSADGEATASMMRIRMEDSVMIWSILHRTIDGESLPDITLRLAPSAPAPAAE